MDKFRKLGIIEPIIKVIEESKFTEPSEIQEKAIPLVLQGKDVIAGASTGSGLAAISLSDGFMRALTLLYSVDL